MCSMNKTKIMSSYSEYEIVQKCKILKFERLLLILHAHNHTHGKLTEYQDSYLQNDYDSHHHQVDVEKAMLAGYSSKAAKAADE